MQHVTARTRQRSAKGQKCFPQNLKAALWLYLWSCGLIKFLYKSPSVRTAIKIWYQQNLLFPLHSTYIVPLWQKSRGLDSYMFFCHTLQNPRKRSCEFNNTELDLYTAKKHVCEWSIMEKEQNSRWADRPRAAENICHIQHLPISVGVTDSFCTCWCACLPEHSSQWTVRCAFLANWI